MTIANDKNFWAFNLKFLFECLAFKVHNYTSYKSQNCFLAGANQVIQSNLFLLGYEAFLARQTSITVHHISRNPILLIKQVFLLHFIVHAISSSMQEKLIQWYFKPELSLELNSSLSLQTIGKNVLPSKKLSGQNLYLSRHCPLTSPYIELCSMYQS